MSNTPRTDDQERWILSEGGRYSVVGSHFARDLERELAAANERIRRLEP